MPTAPNTSTDIVPLGSACLVCGKADGERHAYDCAIGSQSGRIRVRVQNVLASDLRGTASEIFQASKLIDILEDAIADSTDPEPLRIAMMTLAEARNAQDELEYDVAASIALDGLETLFGETFIETPVERAPAARLTLTTITLAQRTLAVRLEQVQDEIRALVTYRPDPAEHGEHLPELELEESMIAEALRELAAVAAQTPGTSAA